MTTKITSGVGCKWMQAYVSLPAQRRGVHKITNRLTALPIKDIRIGTMNIVIQHTSASLSLNECWDDSVRDDMEMMLNRLAPQNAPYTHTLEGPDDMPAHVKCSLMGSSLTIPITEGKLNLGTWQGIWLCEHRDHGGSRNLVVTIQGCE